MKKFNVQPTLEAYLELRDKMKKYNLPSFRAHEDLLTGVHLSKHGNYYRKMLGDLESRSPEVLYSTFVGKVAERFPNTLANGRWVETNDGLVWQSAKWDDFQKEEIKKIGAALLVNILIDSGEYEMESRVEKAPKGSKKAFIRRMYLKFNGVEPTRELTYGLETKPGVFYQKMVGDQSLTTQFKHVLSELGSMAFKASDVMSFEFLVDGYRLSKDWKVKNPKGVGEPRSSKKERYKDYARFIMSNIATMDKFYLPMKYDSRSRMYYLFQLIGMRPQGHLWETQFIDAAEP